MHPTRAHRYVLYARKSTDREDKQMLSIPAQIEELTAAMPRRGVVISEQRTEHFSARRPGRPVFSKLLDEIERGKVDGLVCWTLDRLARNPVDAGRLTYALGEGLLKEIVTHDAVYTGTGDTKFMLQVLFGAATKMSDDLVIGVKRGNRAVHERGRITGRPPLGYTKQRETRFHRGAALCVPDPERYEQVRAIWTDMLTGTMTVSDAWRRAVARGLQGASAKNDAGNPIAIETVHAILRNRFYAGQVVRCGEVYRGDHVPMVTLGEFARVQELMAKRGKPRKRRNTFIYAGMLECECGNALVGEKARGRSAYYTYYRCHRKLRGRVVCRAPSPSESQVTADIEQFLENITLSEPLARWTLDALDWWRRRGTEQADEIAREARRQATVLAGRLEKLTDHFLDGAIDRSEYDGRKLRLQLELAELQQTVESPGAAVDAFDQAVRELVDVGRAYAERFRNGSPDERRAILGRLVSNHIVTARKTKPVLRFPYSILAEPRPTLLGGRPPGSNRFPRAEKVLEYETTARSGERISRGLVSWWTRVLTIRTPSTCPGPTGPGISDLKLAQAEGGGTYGESPPLAEAA